MQPISSFFAHMATSVIDGRMPKSLQHLHVVVCHEQQTPSKVIESVNCIHAAATSNACKAQSDSGLAAVFSGINQGKTLLKLANASALQAQKDTGHAVSASQHLVHLKPAQKALCILSQHSRPCAFCARTEGSGQLPPPASLLMS